MGYESLGLHVVVGRVAEISFYVFIYQCAAFFKVQIVLGECLWLLTPLGKNFIILRCF